jgi:hypothetical protein
MSTSTTTTALPKADPEGWVPMSTQEALDAIAKRYGVVLHPLTEEEQLEAILRWVECLIELEAR